MIIGIAGVKGAGKTTLAAMLVEKHNFIRQALSDPIKSMLSTLLLRSDMIGENKEQPSPHLLGCTPRRAMQTLGTEWGRNLIHPDIWVHTWARVVARYEKSVVADDVRFPNEVEKIKSLGGKMIGIIGFRTRTNNTDTHPSETSIDVAHLDFIIVNKEGKQEEMLRDVEEALGLKRPPS